MISKVKKIGIIFLVIAICLSVTSLTLSLFRKDKTTSPPGPVLPKPIYKQVITSGYDFSEIENTATMVKVVCDDTFTDCFSLKYDASGDGTGGPIFFYIDSSSIPAEGTKIVVEFDYTMEFEAFSSVGIVLDNYPYGFDSAYGYLPTGSHSARIVFEGLDPNYDPEDGYYSEYSFTVYVDGVEDVHYCDSVTGGKISVQDVQGFGFFSFDPACGASDGDILFTLHSLTFEFY